MATGEWYDILLIGSVGMGKSTAGNKLLKITPSENQSIPHTPEEDKFFVTKGGHASTTQYCKLLPKKNSEVRVMDTPGFSDSRGRQFTTYEANMYTFRNILLNQRKNNIAFSRVLYFLPHRGPLRRADGRLQEEIKVMYDFFDKAIFNVMVIIATNHEDSLFQIMFGDEEAKSTEDAFMTAFEGITGEKLPKCPPILYLPVDETNLLSRVKDAPVLHDTPLHLETKDEKCAKCSAMLTYTCVRNEKVLIGAGDGEKVPVEDSKCHPYFIPKYSEKAKAIGGFFYILTLGIPLLYSRLHEMRCWRTHICKLLRNKCCCLQMKIMCWPGFTNEEKVCFCCKRAHNAEGCSKLKRMFKKETREGMKDVKTCHWISGLPYGKY